MKLHLKLSSETVRSNPVIHRQGHSWMGGRGRVEPLFVGAPTEKPGARMKALRLKAACALAVLVTLLGASQSRAILPPATGFTYQGKLSDGGQPANGNYDLIFHLCDDPVVGNAIGSPTILTAVPITNGLFTVELNAAGEFGPNPFDGQGRWLAIGVRTNNNNISNNFVYLNPRQPLTPAPQALFALTTKTVSDGGITASKLAPGALVWTNITGLPSGFADGVDNDTTYTAGLGLNLGASNQFNVNFGVSGIANTAARSDHGHFGASWNGNSSGYGMVVVNNSINGMGIYGQQGTGSGQSYLFGHTSAIWGEASQGDAIYGASSGPTASGVYGYATATSGANSGVYGKSSSSNGVGVFAVGSGTSGTALKVANGAIRVANAGPGTSTPVFVHLVTTNNLVHYKQSTVIDNPYCNNDPNAILFVTAGAVSWNYVGSSPSVGAVYDIGFESTNRWMLARTDGGQFTEGDKYFVMVVKP